jgi:hypothetical protein
MSTAPAFARISLISIRLTGIINTIWAAYVATAAAILFLSGDPRGHGAAWEGALIYLSAHLLSNVIGLTALLKWRCVPNGMVPTVAVGSTAVLLLAGLASYRAAAPTAAPIATLIGVIVLVAAFVTLLRIGRTHRWLPRMDTLRHLLRQSTPWIPLRSNTQMIGSAELDDAGDAAALSRAPQVTAAETALPIAD